MTLLPVRWVPLQALYYADERMLRQDRRERGRRCSGGVRMSLHVLLQWSACPAPAVLTVGGATAPAYGQHPYPVRPIRMIASQFAGGGVDAVARLAAARLTQAFGQNVVVDNRQERTARSPSSRRSACSGAAISTG
jgi:hypothetical protein